MSELPTVAMAFKLHPNAPIHPLIIAQTLVSCEYHQISLDLTLSKPISSPPTEKPNRPMLLVHGRETRKEGMGGFKRGEKARVREWLHFHLMASKKFMCSCP
ncbi:hypothetical protein COLO4_32182 [Corchorus olitorius]|uniref:Uncharacterized protein n=1 Tax=Corchorus olitorius TaxID=93759 RepID=A0A1R3H0K6_9ROSI|nr:hypothetical protein COLO4_32182 [Corchorus olitorius]